MKFFNTAGPIKTDLNYYVPPLDRIDVTQILNLGGQSQFCVLHAPTQSGITSTLFALRDKINEGEQYRAAYLNVETAQPANSNVRAGMQAILSLLSCEAEHHLNDPYVREIWQETLNSKGEFEALAEVLMMWSEIDSRPLFLIIDEIDVLSGDMLISMLHQLRSGLTERSEKFPQHVILFGVRSVRNYRIHSSLEKAGIPSGSAFNVITESIRLGDFDEFQTRSLLLQHTGETGQGWSESALKEVWNSTRGQPWLVNSLANEACETVKDQSRPICHDDIIESRETLISRCDIHLYELVYKLREERVKRVIEPLLSDELETAVFKHDDVQYLRDLGLIRVDPPIAIANPIYREVIPRELIHYLDRFIPYETEWFLENSRLTTGRLLETFQNFFREQSDNWIQKFNYQIAGSQLLLQAFLQRIVNISGRIEREYGAGRRHTNLLVEWKKGDVVQKFVIECRVSRNGLKRDVSEGIDQTRDYMDRCGTDEGHLVIFDRSEGRSWEERLFRRDEVQGGKPVTVWGM